MVEPPKNMWVKWCQAPPLKDENYCKILGNNEVNKFYANAKGRVMFQSCSCIVECGIHPLRRS